MKYIPAGEELISHWYKTELGRRVYAAESFELGKILPNLFGFHLLQIGGPDSVEWISETPIRHHVGVNTSATSKAKTSSVFADWHALPFPKESIDVVLLPHLLEIGVESKKMLEEAISVLVPEGTIIILGFNPCSLFGLAKYCSRGEVGVLGKLQLHSAYKCRSWLEMNNCQIIKHRTFYFQPPYKIEWADKKKKLLEKLGSYFIPGLGGVYLLMARKRVQTLTPLRISTKKVQILSRKNVVAPTPRSSG